MGANLGPCSREEVCQRSIPCYGAGRTLKDHAPIKCFSSVELRTRQAKFLYSPRQRDLQLAVEELNLVVSENGMTALRNQKPRIHSRSRIGIEILGKIVVAFPLELITRSQKAEPAERQIRARLQRVDAAVKAIG